MIDWEYDPEIVKSDDKQFRDAVKGQKRGFYFQLLIAACAVIWFCHTSEISVETAVILFAIMCAAETIMRHVFNIRYHLANIERAIRLGRAQ